MGLGRFVCDEVRELIRPVGRVIRRASVVYVSTWTRCPAGCGATVRLVGTTRLHGSWHCPVCGCAFPYVFWKVRSEPGGPRKVTADELIHALADGCCEECGELPVCRCERRRQAEEARA